MGVCVYRKGSTHTENGIPVEMRVIEPNLLDGAIADGWVLTPEETMQNVVVSRVADFFTQQNPESKEKKTTPLQSIFKAMKGIGGKSHD